MDNAQILALGNKEKIKVELENKYPGALDAVRTSLNVIDDKPDREGLVDTPYRVVKSWLELFGGYDEDPEKILGTVFKDDVGERTDEIIICKDIAFYSMCEHHMLPFRGTCHIGYLPGKDGGVVGLSKLARLTECFGRRLQIQEKMTSQIADTIMDILGADGAGVVIQAQHLCMCARGAKNQSSEMITSAMRGKFRTVPECRNEFLNLINM